VRWRLRAPALAALASLPFAAGFLWLPTPALALASFAPFYVLANAYVAPVWWALQGIAKLRMRATISALFQFILNLIGLGAGPLVVGMLNDFFAARLGDDAIRWSLTSAMLFGVIGGMLLLRAAQALPGDLAARDDDRPPG
jgi:hypothetical protein